MNANDARATARDLLLVRRGLTFLEPTGPGAHDEHVRAVELELADLGYVLSTRLRARLCAASLDELVAWRAWAWAVLAAHLGADRRHEPLFRNFPNDVPSDTLELWMRKVLVHFAQADGQPCLFCRRTGTTHVLEPCHHVVCDRCFDGASYGACPVCEHHVDRSSPFFEPAKPNEGSNVERVTFELLDLGESADAEVKTLFVSLCERKQALSPVDREALVVILREYGARVLEWLPTPIPVKENVAIVFGTLFQECAPDAVLPVARRYMVSATDVLRFLAVLSGADASLQRETVFATVERLELPHRWWGKISAIFGASAPGPRSRRVTIPLRVNRFKVARLRRPLRRALLAILEGFAPDTLVEDMLRHRSHWVWVGEFLHPHEYAARFPNVARAFAIVRTKSPDGARAPAFHGFYGKLEVAVRAKDATAMVGLLAKRPGELARRFDHALRVAGDDASAKAAVVEAFTAKTPLLATPMLVGLHALLPTRRERAAVRIYWPKGQVARGVSSADGRAVLSSDAIDPAVHAIEAELLRRFATKPAFDTFLIDAALRRIIVPFNERTASASAVSLPRGSRIDVPAGKVVRLFLHWCQPEKGGTETDIDLSVGFYDDAWTHVGVCSYYQLKTLGRSGEEIAVSAGDLRDAPFPDGATELVDVHRDRALANGVRYAVMVVNNYAGMPFSRLERGFAGLMLRDDPGGRHFDPRTVELKFALNGENGLYMPLVLDLREDVLHWLDVHSKGQLAFNNVASSNAAITKICPEMMAYFASGVRASMYDLALLHAAARARRVIVRGKETRALVRRAGEDAGAFHRRLVAGGADESLPSLPTFSSPVLAALYEGDVDLPSGSLAYALFRGRLAPSLAASDFLS